MRTSDRNRGHSHVKRGGMRFDWEKLDLPFGGHSHVCSLNGARLGSVFEPRSANMMPRISIFGAPTFSRLQLNTLVLAKSHVEDAITDWLRGVIDNYDLGPGKVVGNLDLFEGSET